ncbi:MAG: DUF86 domain-containing protein [Oscillospiraceae bacterium]|nr:DUF86 domain-containing protein [Oscillospiraceae bacterium]
MQHRDNVILKKINSELSLALDMLCGVSFNDFDENEVLKRAVCMTVINIGELVKNLSEELRKEHSHIPWKFIAGFRDVAAHKYQTLKMKDVYKIVFEDFPELKSNIDKILSSEALSN